MTAASLALAACEIWRPSGLDGAVEVVVAGPANRSFPTRMTQALGICLKLGASHTLHCDGRRLEYPAHALCIRPPGCVWSCGSTGAVGFVSIDIDPSGLPSEAFSGRMTFLPGAELPEMQRAVAVLRRARSTLLRQEAVAALVNALEERLRPDRARQDGPRTAVARAREVLAARLGSPPTLDELARITGANKFVLLRHFKRELGITPHALVVAMRIDEARTLLGRGVPQADTAVSLGFADQAHFSRTFKRAVGMTPGQYVRQARAVSAPTR